MEENLSIRVKPNSQPAEVNVIGSMIRSNWVIDDVAEILEKEDFYYPQYGIIFDAVIKTKNEGLPVDIPILMDKLGQMGAPPEIKDGSFLLDIANASEPRNAVPHAELIKNKSMLRQIIDRTVEIESLCYEGSQSVDEILEETDQKFMALLQKRGIKDHTPIEQIVEEAMESIRESYKNKGALTGIPTGFIDLDRMTAGMQKSDLILVAARPSMGKTAFALNVANHVALRENKGVAIFSLEMSAKSLMNRLFSIEAGVDAQKLRTGMLEEYDWPRLIDGSDEIAQSNLIIDETPSITISELRSKCRKYKQQKDIQLIVIDYLQLITTSGKGESRQQEISNISRSLKSLARELDVPVIAISQLNRGAELREDKRPMLSDLRDSGAIEQDADVVLLLYRDDYYNKESKEKGVSEIIIAKQRNGPTGTIQLSWLAAYTRFANRDKARNTTGGAD